MTDTANTVTRRFRVWTYDVWGNAKDGYEVNDRYSHGYVEIECAAEIFNPCTPHEFTTYNPTDEQLCDALGVTNFARFEWEGDGDVFYCQRSKDGRPMGELEFDPPTAD